MHGVWTSVSLMHHITPLGFSTRQCVQHGSIAMYVGGRSVYCCMGTVYTTSDDVRWIFCYIRHKKVTA